MDRTQLYQDIALRTQGDIYIGVVGPVRTGKSTFIRRFMELLVLPNVDNEHIKARIVDEMPQSGSGRTIMTTQPKFVPNDAVRIEFPDQASCEVRMVDCVGYMIPGALGHMEDEAPRMVRTPWFDYDLPFDEAAELGTQKVIREHSSIGIVMTTDGTITELPRENYIAAEERVVKEMQQTGKPFVVIVNSMAPDGEKAQKLAESLTQQYGVSALALDVMHMNGAEASTLLEEILLSFPLCDIEIRIPSFMRALPATHPLMQRVLLPVYSNLEKLHYMRDYRYLCGEMEYLEQFLPLRVDRIELGTGKAILSLYPEEGLFYEVLSEECGYEIRDDFALMTAMKAFVEAKTGYDRIAGALLSAKQTGYGVVPPAMDEMELDEPEIVKQGGLFAVKLRAHASGLHIIRVDIESEISPTVGSAQQSEALACQLNETFAQDPTQLWQTNIFGKSLYDLVRESMSSKVNDLPDNVQRRMQTTLQRIVNDGCNGLICIMF